MIEAAVITIVTSAATGFITWAFTRKKTQAETIKLELENVQSVIKLWQNIAEDLGKKVTELSRENQLLRGEMADLKEELQHFKHAIELKVE